MYKITRYLQLSFHFSQNNELLFVGDALCRSKFIFGKWRRQLCSQSVFKALELF